MQALTPEIPVLCLMAVAVSSRQKDGPLPPDSVGDQPWVWWEK